MTTLKTLTIAALAAATLGACAPAANDGMKNSFGPDQPARSRNNVNAVVRVENQNWSDMVVYVVQGSMRMRLGTVTSMRSVTFRVPHVFQGNGGEIRLLADPIGSGETYLSDPVRLRDGEQLSLSVQNSLQLSNIAVFRR